MNDKPRDYSGRRPNAADRTQFGIVAVVGVLVAFITWSIATGIGAALIAALVCVFLGIGED